MRNGKKITKRELAAETNIKYSTYANYESGLREPGYEVITALAKYYNVSVEFMLGADEKNGSETEPAVLDAAERKLIGNYRAADTFGRELIETVAKMAGEKTKTAQNET